MTWLVLLVGVVVGVVSGIVGIGGGILFIPALVWLLGMSQHKAQGTSLGALLAPVGIFAFLEYYRKGNADVRVAALLAVGFLVGGYFGAAHSPQPTSHAHRKGPEQAVRPFPQPRCHADIAEGHPEHHYEMCEAIRPSHSPQVSWAAESGLSVRP